MKIFKTVVLILLIAINLQTGYYALLYKVSTSTGALLICLGITLFVEVTAALKDNKIE